MLPYTFLTEDNREGETVYFAIDPSSIETLVVSETYGNYGQKVTAEDAGDYVIIDTIAAATVANKVDKGNKYAVTDVITAYDDGKTFYEMRYKEGVTLNAETCKGLTFWDGHNFKTIITEDSPSGNAGQMYSVVEDEGLVAELNAAIKTREWEKEGLGQTKYFSGVWEIDDNCWEGEWASYRLYRTEINE